MDTKEFIKKSKLVWGDNVFDYKDVNYINNSTPVVLWYNGLKFTQRPKHHLAHRKPLFMSEKKKHTKEELIELFNKVHSNKYNYGDFEYKNAKEKNIPVYCSVKDSNGVEHGVWYTNASNHLAGYGCPKCKSEKLSSTFSSNKDEFISKSKIIHGDKYDYSKVIYLNNSTPIEIVCPQHGSFHQIPHNHLQGKGCPKCVESKLEERVRKMLEENYIEFKQYYHTKWLKRQSLDFFLPQYNCAIECQGEQHYIEGRFGTPLEHVQALDRTKHSLCEDNKVTLYYYASEKYDKDVYTNLYELINTITGNIILKDENIENLKKFLKTLKCNFTYSVNKIHHSDDFVTIQDRFYSEVHKLMIIYINSYDYRKRLAKYDYNEGISQEYFINETKKFEKEGIKCIWIKDYELNDSYTIRDNDGKYLYNYKRKWEVIKSYIKYSVNECPNTLYARECEIHEVPNQELKQFLNKNSLLGYKPSSINLGLYLKHDKGKLKKGDLVMVYTFGANYFSSNSEKRHIEVIRASTLLDYHVNGGASKLMKHFFKNYSSLKINGKVINTDAVVYYVDADHNSGNTLHSLGFSLFSWNSGFVYVDSNNLTSKMRNPSKYKEMQEKLSSHKYFISPTVGTKVYKLIKAEDD